MEDYSQIKEEIFEHSIYDNYLNPINKLVLDSYNIQKNPGNLKYNEKIISYKLEGNKLKICYNDINYEIEAKPYIIYDENKKQLGVAYTYEIFDNIMTNLFNQFDIYDSNDHLLNTQQEILNNETRKYILKVKNEFTFEKFNSLNSKRNFNINDINPIEIPKKELSPIPYKEFHHKSAKMNLILEKRISLINYINKFMENWIEKILIIYGCDGIGKSATFIYLSNLFNHYKVLYFNIKLIMSNEKESYNIFTFEIMRYYTADKNEITNKNINNMKYSEYLKEIKNINKIKFDFWEELLKFVKLKLFKKKTLLIIDQYKEDFDENNINLNALQHLLLNQIGFFKLLISFSVNDSNTKNKLIKDLKYCSINSPIKKMYPQKITEEDNFEQIFDNLNLKNNIYNKNQDDKQFPNIALFKNYNKGNDNNKKEAKENEKNKEEKEKETKEIETKDNSKYNNKDNNINKDIQEQKEDYASSYSNSNKIKIIYINQLISLKSIIDDKIIDYFNIFDYNPKYYIKFLNFISENSHHKIDLNKLFKIFLDNIYNKISEKLLKYFKKISNKNSLMNDPIMELIKLKELVDNNVRFTAPLLIEYVMEYPVKYIKIKKVIGINNIKEEVNIIDLNNQFKDTEFYFEYCFPFFGTIISKLIYMNEKYHWINFENLSGSAKDSFIKQKFRRNIVHDKIFSEAFNIRYVWDFYSPIKKITKDINQIDYENYEKISYDENKQNLFLSFSNYYIIPGNQTNKNIDSALLIYDFSYKKYILITFQIKQGEALKIKKKICI